MAIWYEVEKTEEGMETFLDCNWSFHDFRLEQIKFLPAKDMVEVFLKYDTEAEGVLLRFLRIYAVAVNNKWDYEADWISGCSLISLDNDNMVWIDNDEWEDKTREHLEEIKTYST